MEKYHCQCSCKDVNFIVPELPKDIANCHCTICKNLNNKQFISFARYNKNDIQLDFTKFAIFESSNRAKRYKCNNCNDWICMIYNNSDNIWIVADRFMFTCKDIETYDIYR